jgi:hypothetical protein
MVFNIETMIYPLVNILKKLLNMAIENADFP